MKSVGVTLDDKTMQLLDGFGQKHGLGRSAVIRLAVNEFFINKGGWK